MKQLPENKLKHDQYIRLLMTNQNKIYTYIHMLVPSVQDADDIMQETASTIWEKIDSFKPGTDFASWAVTIARFKIMNYRRLKNNSIVQYSSRTLEAIDNYASEHVHQELPIKEYLKDCLQMLSPKDRSLVQMRYAQSITTKALARNLGRSLHGLYSTLSRIQLLLLECIDRRKSAEERL